MESFLNVWFLRCLAATGQPITLQGTRGAAGERLTVIDGSDAYVGGWTLHSGSGTSSIYRTTSAPYTIGHMQVDDKHILKMRDPCTPNESRSGGVAVRTECPSWPVLYYRNLLVAYWDAWAELWTGSNPAYVRFRNGDNPTGKNMRVCPPSTATLRLTNVHHLTVQGLILRGCYWQIHLQTGGNDIIIDDNEVINGFAQIVIDGPQRFKITNNSIHQHRTPTGYLPGPMNLTAADSPPTLPAATPGTYQYRAGIASQLNWFFKTKSQKDGIAIDMIYNGAPRRGD